MAAYNLAGILAYAITRLDNTIIEAHVYLN